MRAVRSEDGRAAVVDVPRPSGSGVRVHVESVGICGSDHHLLHGPWSSILGHEIAGHTEDGTAVAVEPYAPCGSCAACRSFQHHHCELGPSMVLGVGRDGGMAEECIVPESALVRLPAGLRARDACLAEPLALAVRAVNRAVIRPGQRVGVVGAGTIGLVTVIAAQAAGALVDVFARHDHQREAASALGAGEIGPTSGGYDVTVEAAGSEAAFDHAVELCRAEGLVLGLGSYWEDTALNLRPLTRREISFVPSRGYGRQGAARDFDVAAALLAARPEVSRLLITHRFALDDAPEAFAVSTERGAGAIKVVLEPSGSPEEAL
jgi:threonine dehydrogenase-like Zn-dependent dehydrogenase